MKKLLIRFRTAMLVFLTHRMALPLIRRMRSSPNFDHDIEDLSLLPDGSLGRDLYLFLEKRDLPLLPYYARHDIKHVLLGYDTTDEGEACLQSFMLGNGRISFPVLATVLFGFITMPEHWSKMKVAYRRGKESNAFHHWSWNTMVWEPTSSLQEKIFNNE